MSATSVQFTVAAHVMAALGFFQGQEIASAALAESVNAIPRSRISARSKGLTAIPSPSFQGPGAPVCTS
jgi:hypothetical protein